MVLSNGWLDKNVIRNPQFTPPPPQMLTRYLPSTPPPELRKSFGLQIVSPQIIPLPHLAHFLPHSVERMDEVEGKLFQGIS